MERITPNLETYPFTEQNIQIVKLQSERTVCPSAAATITNNVDTVPVNASQQEEQFSYIGRVSSRQTSQPRPHTYVADTPMTEANPFAHAQLMSKSPADMNRHPSTNYSETEMPAWARSLLKLGQELCDKMDQMNDKIDQGHKKLLDGIDQMNNKIDQGHKELLKEIKQMNKNLDETIEPNKEEKLNKEENTNANTIKNNEHTDCDNHNFNLTTTRPNLKRHKKKCIPKKKKQEKKKRPKPKTPNYDRKRKRKAKSANAAGDATSDATMKRPVSHSRVRSRSPTLRPERMNHFILVEQDFIRHQGKWSPWMSQS